MQSSLGSRTHSGCYGAFNAFRKVLVYLLTICLTEIRQFLSLIGSSGSWLFAAFHAAKLLRNTSLLVTFKYYLSSMGTNLSIQGITISEIINGEFLGD